LTDATACGMASSKFMATHLLGFMESNVERLSATGKDAAVHLSDSALGFLRSGKANEAEATSYCLFILHDLDALDLTEETKLLAKAFLVNLILKVLHVEVDTLILSHAVKFDLLKFLAELSFALSLLLRTASPHLLRANSGAIDRFHCLQCIFVVIEVYKSESTARAFFVAHYDST
jgi:hypothetical protein